MTGGLPITCALSFDVDRVAEQGWAIAITYDKAEPIAGMWLNGQQHATVINNGCRRNDFPLPYPLNLLARSTRNRCRQNNLACGFWNGTAHLPALALCCRLELKHRSRYAARADVHSTLSQTVQQGRF